MAATTIEEIEISGLEERDPRVIGASNGASEGGLRHRSPQYEDIDDDPAVADGYADLSYVDQQAVTSEERKWAWLLLAACVGDVIASSTFVIVAFSHAYNDYGVSLYCLGFQAVSHLLSSILLLLRFVVEMAPLKRRPGNEYTSEALLLRKRRRKILAREQVFCIIMGIVMLISAASMIFKAFRKIRFWDKWHLDHKNLDDDIIVTTEWLAWWGFATYVIQAVIRCMAAIRTSRSIVWHGFWASVTSLLFLLVLAIAARKEREWSWKAEAIAAIILAMGMLLEAIRIVISYLDDMETRLRHETKA